MRGRRLPRFWLVVGLGAVVALAGGLLPAGVSAAPPSVSVGSLSTGVGLEGAVSLKAHDMAAPGLGAWTIDVMYDPEVVTAVECSAAHGGICNLAYAEGTVRVTGTTAFGFEGDAVLGTLVFACTRVGVTELALTLSVLADATPGGPQPIDAAVTNGSVTCTGEGEALPPASLPDGLGDVNCDGEVNSIDAALVLQLSAALIDSVPCPENGDLNGDGAIDSMDAALILQREAGIIE